MKKRGGWREGEREEVKYKVHIYEVSIGVCYDISTQAEHLWTHQLFFSMVGDIRHVQNKKKLLFLISLCGCNIVDIYISPIYIYIREEENKSPSGWLYERFH